MPEGEEVGASRMAALSTANTEIDNKNEEYFISLPPGCRFCPSDVELVTHYLMKKVKKKSLPLNQMHELNIYDYNPDQLAVIKKPAFGTKKWYFFTSRTRRYQNGNRTNRKAGDGFWKTSVGDKEVTYQGSTVGFKKTLVYHRGKLGGNRTNWIMQEFTLPNTTRNKTKDTRKLDWVLCKLYKKEERDCYVMSIPIEDIPEYFDPTLMSMPAEQVHPADNNLVSKPTEQVHPAYNNLVSKPTEQVHPTDSNSMSSAAADAVKLLRSNLMSIWTMMRDDTGSNLMSIWRMMGECALNGCSALDLEMRERILNEIREETLRILDHSSALGLQLRERIPIEIMNEDANGDSALDPAGFSSSMGSLSSSMGSFSDNLNDFSSSMGSFSDMNDFSSSMASFSDLNNFSSSMASFPDPNDFSSSDIDDLISDHVVHDHFPKPF